MRYAQPRKIKTRRGERKALLNAWCLTCRQPMARHGKNFTCSTCHVATRIVLTCGQRKGGNKGSRSESPNPFCRNCRVRMHSRRNGTSHQYRCPRCKTIVAMHRDLSERLHREGEIIRLIQEGFIDKQIVRRLHCHHRTAARLRLTVANPRRCECGQLFHHTSKCHRRPGWQTLVRERRTTFDDLLVRISRRVPRALPEEMRAEICQQMLMDVAVAIDRILDNSQHYIRKYKKEYPFQFYSFDDPNAKLNERLVG